VRSAGRLARTLRRRIPRGLLTDTARRSATGKTAERTMRAASRALARLRGTA
jgi:hypothetical protein